MADEKKEPWLDYLALTTVILAVCATLSTFKGGSYSTKSVITQAMASDQWAYYQAKSVKGNMYEVQKEKLELELSTMTDSAPANLREQYSKLISEYSEKGTRYTEERSAIEKEAKRLEKLRDDYQRHSQPFGIAVIFLQIAILISSIAGLFKRKQIWLVALPLAITGIAFFANGFFLFF